MAARGLPGIASIGATLVPALIYIGVVDLLDEPMLEIGWPVPFATDIAVSYFVARIIFRKEPVVPFLLLLAIASDALGFLALALFHPMHEFHLRRALIMTSAIGWPSRAPCTREKLLALSAGGRQRFCLALFWIGLHPAPRSGPRSFLPASPAREVRILLGRSSRARDTRLRDLGRSPRSGTFFVGLVNPCVAARTQAVRWRAGSVIAGTLVSPGAGVGAAAGLHLPQRFGG